MSQTHAPTDEAEPGGAVRLTLDRAAAVVALDFLARLVDDQEGEALRDSIEHPAEMAALWSLIAALEQVAGDPLADDYREVVDKARAAVVTRLEGGI